MQHHEPTYPPPTKRARWTPIERVVSHCDSKPSIPNPLQPDAAVKPYHSVTNSPNQVWVSGPPTPPTGEMTPNALAINLIQSLAEGKVIVEGDQISHVKETMNVIQAEVDALPKETETPANKTLMVNMPPIEENNKECEIVHVEEGDESIKEMLDKEVNYGNKMKYTDGRVNRTKNAKKKDLELEKKRKIQELVEKGILTPIYESKVGYKQKMIHKQKLKKMILLNRWR